MMLNSLKITNFRMLEDFQVSKLGRVNLIVGKNNSGKSSVLEALRIYAGNAQRGVLQRIARSHNERIHMPSSREELDELLPFEAFFTGRQFRADGESTISIGQVPSDPDTLSITYGFLTAQEVAVETDDGLVTNVRSHFTAFSGGLPDDEDVTPCLRVSKRERSFIVRLKSGSIGGRLPLDVREERCSFIPTQFVSLDELADEWDRVALTDEQVVIKEALQIIVPEFEGITFVRDVGARELQRTAKVKLATFSRPVPLNSLGDGVVRILQLVLKLFSARGGFFLIDEFENGLHFSVQEKIWALMFRMAARLDIQVFATTHSWDCIESFARAAHADKATEGLLFRVGQSVRTSDRGRTIATVFDEEQLYGITQTDVEVR